MISKTLSRHNSVQLLMQFRQLQQSDKPLFTPGDPRPAQRLLLQLSSLLLSNRLKEFSKPTLLSLEEKTLSSLTSVADLLTSLSDQELTSDDPFQSPTSDSEAKS